MRPARLSTQRGYLSTPSVRPFSLAAWLAFLVRKDHDGRPLPLNDPKTMELQTALEDAETPGDIIHAAAGVCPGILPAALTDGAFGSALHAMLTDILSNGMNAVIHREAEQYS